MQCDFIHGHAAVRQDAVSSGYIDSAARVRNVDEGWPAPAGGERPDPVAFDAAMRNLQEGRGTSAEPVAPPFPAGGGTRGGEGAGPDVGQVALDLTRLTLDITGIVDPTPISDGANAFISLTRGDWTGALISGVSILPGGDVAKLAKLDRLRETLDGVSDLVRTSPGAASALRAPLEAAQELLSRAPVDSLPEVVRGPIRTFKSKVDEALDAMRSAEAPPSQPAVTASVGTDGGGRATGAGGEAASPTGAEGAPPSAAAGGGDRPGGPPPTGGDRAPPPAVPTSPAARMGRRARTAASRTGPRPTEAKARKAGTDRQPRPARRGASTSWMATANPAHIAEATRTAPASRANKSSRKAGTTTGSSAKSKASRTTPFPSGTTWWITPASGWRGPATKSTSASSSTLTAWIS